MSDRIQQIADTAIRVAPVERGEWRLSPQPGPADSVLIAPADLGFLIRAARGGPEAAAARVRALHHTEDGTWCQQDGFGWPCPTIRALDGER